MKSAITLAQNISRIRKENRLTQEDLATFLGVTKASVSKWETGQSHPDIELLPRIATYFGISIDELLGYEPQMSRQAIRIICAKLRKAFAEEPFEQAHDACKRLVRDYFSCYPLLVQIASLYLNHMNLASPEERDGLVAETFEICGKLAFAFENSQGTDLTMRIDHSSSDVTAGIVVTLFMTACVIICALMYNKNTRVDKEKEELAEQKD